MVEKLVNPTPQHFISRDLASKYASKVYLKTGFNPKIYEETSGLTGQKFFVVIGSKAFR